MKTKMKNIVRCPNPAGCSEKISLTWRKPGDKFECPRCRRGLEVVDKEGKNGLAMS